MDGKDLRDTSKQTGNGRQMMVVAVEHGTDTVLGQIEVDVKSNKIPAVRDLAGRVVAVDVMHARHETARWLLRRCADHVVIAIRENQETILDDLKIIDFADALSFETFEKEHGRIEHGHCVVVDLSGAEWGLYAALHSRRRTIRVEREILKTGERSVEMTRCLTSLGPERVRLEELLALMRDPWLKKDRARYGHDFTDDGHRGRAHVRHAPRTLSCPANAAIAILRCGGHFSYLPGVNRHYACPAQDAPDPILPHAIRRKRAAGRRDAAAVPEHFRNACPDGLDAAPAKATKLARRGPGSPQA